MGLEYKLKFQVSDKDYFESFLKKLSINFENEITILLESDGIYFCDNCTNSPVVSNTFYRLVKEILIHTSELKICEL